MNMDGKIKFDNPDDDKNLFYAQMLFYPLNTQYLSNFDFFIQQVILKIKLTAHLGSHRSQQENDGFFLKLAFISLQNCQN